MDIGVYLYPHNVALILRDEIYRVYFDHIVNCRKELKLRFDFNIEEKISYHGMFKYKDLLKEIPKLICTEEDSVRVYRILGQGEVSLFGVNESIQNEEIIII